MVRYYIVLASGCVLAGIVFTFAVLLITQRLGIDITGRNAWVLAIPVVLAVVLNVFLVEVWQRRRRKKA